VIAATPLGDVVKQGRNVKDPGIAEIADQATAERVLVRELRHRKAAQVAHHLQNVLIDVYTWNRSCCIWPTMRPKLGR
jgi:hypothetical protein